MLVKNHITNFLFIIFMMMPAIVSTCSLDEMTEETGGHDAATVLLTLNVADGPVTRSLSSSNENTVNDLTVLVFDSGKRLIGSTYVGGLSTTTSTTATVTTRVATGCTVYAIANTGSASFFAGVYTVEELNAKYTTLTSAAALMNGNNVLMAGSVSADIKDGSNSISIPIKHLCSKINISIVPSSGITITGYQLCYAALGCYITDSHSSAGSAVTAPANGSGNSYGNFDAVTLSSPTAGTTVTPPVYYVYENLAGSNSKCTTEKLRTSANAPANSMYLLVYAKTRSWHSTYRIYLGGVTNASTPVTDLTNFNVYRNLNYTYTVSITGSGQSDARVTYAADYVAPSIGDIYYSDGTWSSTLEES